MCTASSLACAPSHCCALKFRLCRAGLDNSGKSTIIAQLMKGAVDEVTPTIGYSTKKLVANKINYSVHDMSGQGSYRDLWSQYYGSTDGIIFVIDACDSLRLVMVRDELEEMLRHPTLASRTSVPVLFFANKFDVACHLSMDDVSSQLDLAALLGDRPWMIRESVAVTGEGLDAGMTWLAKALGART